ncbi:hypothetical protein EVAR_16328_1 [Eumeta japonica]|uniref:Uncharacterized protein n=1 Tax=Eumeta variegata TaxID=151549 RepID=A0A4C1VFL3_EUMVA|nr:hypothetical protein EVAR_16328_1 [Eumeta japonica]
MKFSSKNGARRVKKYFMRNVFLHDKRKEGIQDIRKGSRGEPLGRNSEGRSEETSRATRPPEPRPSRACRRPPGRARGRATRLIRNERVSKQVRNAHPAGRRARAAPPSAAITFAPLCTADEPVCVGENKNKGSHR